MCKFWFKNLLEERRRDGGRGWGVGGGGGGGPCEWSEEQQSSSGAGMEVEATRIRLQRIPFRSADESVPAKHLRPERHMLTIK